MFEEVARGAAEDEFVQPGVAVGAHQDQVAAVLACGIDEDVADLDVIDLHVLGLDLDPMAREVGCDIHRRRGAA